MSRKALHLVVDLEIQAVTCPGVWLCPNGNVQLLFSMLGAEVQTKRLPPVFPLLFHERVTVQKTFSNAGCLAEVQDSLAHEDVYAVLLQEVEGSNGGAAVQLARFHSSALHILYPSPCAKGLLAGVDVNLLMEASANYPGILCPKIELSTKTIVKEVASTSHEGYVINPRTVSSQKMQVMRRQCVPAGIETIQSDGQHRSHLRKRCGNRPCVKPKQEAIHNSGLHRSLPVLPNCENQANMNCFPKSHLHCTGRCRLHETSSNCQDLGHQSSKCSLCTQYKAIFGAYSESPDACSENVNVHTDMYRKKPSLLDAFQRTKRLSTALHAHVDHILEPTFSNTLRDGQYLSCLSTPTSPSQSVHPKRNSQEEKKGLSQSRNQTSFSDPCFQLSCGSGDEASSQRHLFYTNLERFYRKLYERAKSRAQEAQPS